jgi:hypothetical protein
LDTAAAAAAAAAAVTVMNDGGVGRRERQRFIYLSTLYRSFIYLSIEAKLVKIPYLFIGQSQYSVHSLLQHVASTLKHFI